MSESNWECANCGKTDAPRSVYWVDFENADEGHLCPDCAEWTSTQKAALWLIHGGMEFEAAFLIRAAAGPTTDTGRVEDALDAVGLKLSEAGA
jgi:recombinational DNA repair protein (RecF pathway)